MSEDSTASAGTDNSTDAGDSASDDTSASTAGTDDAATLRAQLEQAQKDAEKWRTLSRKHEGRARENADAASKAQTVEQQLEQLRKQLSDKESRDAERSGREAVTRVYARLAESGFARKDIEGLLGLIDASTLITDGEPDDKAIDKLADSLVKVAGRTTPDRDQGRKGGDAVPNMTQLIRRSAGYSTQ